ncbi:MAG: RNA-binding protein [Candidatus Colwellbacteria bacterium CG10_big_fil_rev_8_21_14_0_10_42_22]|uniref:RNA-binding protein KhpA n=1 Tax=Candidatus Colwellbacteria bacterium CG10_big_fil_rev_8_21_14_0_10_42_22 TaxID=1974540 RepID=A0A2H0VF42_9BACT|nr:MAG: RNA-binding protein [Candidatus Colwellbacteria bacterium CG10_big_fil_rev_8_21_14_0_10_42_22]
MAEYQDEQFLEYVVKSIVDNPEDVQVSRQIDEMGVLLTLKVNSKDMGQVVGRQGSTAKAIRSLLKIVGIKSNARVNLKIEEPEGGRRAPSKEREERPYRREESSAGLSTNKVEKPESEVDTLSGTAVGKVIDDIKKDL